MGKKKGNEKGRKKLQRIKRRVRKISVKRGGNGEKSGLCQESGLKSS